MVTIQSEELLVTVDELGAEIISVIDRKSNYEFIWQNQDHTWNRHAPILFPIIGKMKNGKYTCHEKSFQLPKHGFARDKDFIIQSKTENSISLNLKNDSLTEKIYPYEFSLQVNYIVYHRQITVSYEILNPSTDEILWYSVGGHPGFKVSSKINQKGKKDFHRVSLEMQPGGHYLRIPINNDGLISAYKAKYELADKHNLSLNDLKKDAIVYQIGKESHIILKDQDNEVEIEVRPTNMDWIGIWSSYPNHGAFVCIEPWAGLPDDEDFNGIWSEKKGLQNVKPNQLKVHHYTMNFNKY